MVFRELFPPRPISRRIFLGSPEAEGEVNENSRVQLAEVYEDFHDLANQLSDEKFILLSRKGCGKTAFAEYAKFISESNANYFCSFVKPDRINLESIVQAGSDQGTLFNKETLFRWIIFTSILSLLLENQAIIDSPTYSDLKLFAEKNAGYIRMNTFEAKELIVNSGFELNIEYLKRFCSTKLKRDIQIKQEKAPFYKILPHLEYVILSILSSELERKNNNNYIVFFDDLDIGYTSNNQSNVDSILSLLRAAKSVNNESFGKYGVNAKIILLLRSDIAKRLALQAADAAKLFTTYSTTINWYQDGYGKTITESDLNLKRFINNRISNAFDKAKLQYDKSDPWNSLVTNRGFDKSSFDYILDFTLFRPRDLLLFFLPLSTDDYKFPLDWQSLQVLARKYSDEFIKEFRNELIADYNNDQINSILNALTELTKISDCSFGIARSIIVKHCDFKNPDDILQDLFERSAIGTLEPNGYYYFKCREHQNSADEYCISPTATIVPQKTMKLYCSRRQTA